MFDDTKKISPFLWRQNKFRESFVIDGSNQLIDEIYCMQCIHTMSKMSFCCQNMLGFFQDVDPRSLLPVS